MDAVRTPVSEIHLAGGGAASLGFPEPLDAARVSNLFFGPPLGGFCLSQGHSLLQCVYMVRKSYAHLGKLAHSAASPLLRVYMKGKRRVRALIVNERDEVLLVRSWFGHQRWSLPGGGIRSGEEPVVAAVRETFEETGVTIDERKCRRLGEFANGDSNAPFTVDCWATSIEKQPAHIAARHRLEMLDVAWFSLKHLPSRRSKTVDRALKLYNES